MSEAAYLRVQPASPPVWETPMRVIWLVWCGLVIGWLLAAQVDERNERILRLEEKSQVQAIQLARIETKLEALASMANVIGAAIGGFLVKEAGAMILYFARKKKE